ncbi:MAG: hypothetical protein IJU28_02280 [Clostridia bacterium]|nr:hypothetical protein [Clostridia bacterium]
MRKLLCILLALCLALPWATALGEGQKKLFTTRYFTVEIPNDWVADYSGLSQTKDSWELGYLYPPGDSTLCVYAEIEYYDEWKDVSLWRQNEAEMAEYTRVLLKDYESYAPELIDTLYVGRVPFLLLKLTDTGSCFYWAETMTNGYMVGFECYALDERFSGYRDVTQAELETFLNILNSFVPIH